MDLNQILQSFIGNAGQQINATQQMVQTYDKDTAQIASLFTENEQQATAAVQEAGLVAQQEAEVAYRIQAAKERTAAIAGMNPDDANNEYVRSMAAFNAEQRLIEELEPKRAEAMRVVESMAGADILSDPLKFLVAQFALPQAAAAHNQILNMESEAISRRDAAARNISVRAEMIRQKDSLIAANTSEEVKKITLRKTQLAQAQAQIQLRQARAENIGKIGARALDSFRLAQDTFKIQSDLLNKMMSLEQWKVQRAALDEERAARAAARMEAEAKKKEADEETAFFNERLAAASYALGYTAPINVTMLKTLPADRREQIVQVALSGQFGNGVLSSIQTLRQAGNFDAVVNTNPGMAQALRGYEMGIQSYVPLVTNEALKTGTKLKPKEQATEAADSYEQDVVSSAQSFAAPKSLNSAQWDKIFNPYKPQYLVVTDMVDAGRVPQLKGNAVVQATKTLRANIGNRSNLDGTEMETLLKTLAMEVANGRLPLDKAAVDIAAFHRVAAAKNLELYNYTQFGFPQQTSAIISVQPVTMFSEPFKLDLMDPASVKTNLARMAREQKLGTIGMIGNAFAVPENAGQTIAPKLFEFSKPQQ